jgi:hypothetical protein
MTLDDYRARMSARLPLRERMRRKAEAIGAAIMAAVLIAAVIAGGLMLVGTFLGMAAVVMLAIGVFGILRRQGGAVAIAVSIVAAASILAR